MGFYSHRDLNAARLPVPPPGRGLGYEYMDRGGDVYWHSLRGC